MEEVPWYLISSPWSPDGTHLLVWNSADRGLYSLPVDGGEPRFLVQDAMSCPSFAPDGSEIVVGVWETTLIEGKESRAAVLWILGSDGSRRREIARAVDEAPGFVSIEPFRPSWSPDGKWIAHASGQGIELVRPDLSERRQIGGGIGHSWSPAGDMLVTTSWDPVRLHNRIRIHWVDRPGVSRDLTRGSLPSWSPDGRRLAFMDNPDGPAKYEAFVIDVDGSNRRRLCADYLPRWSRTDRILMLRTSGGTPTLVTLAPDGTGERTLASGAHWGQWSPDGRRLAFGRDGEVFVIDADGTNERSLGRPRAALSEPAD